MTLLWHYLRSRRLRFTERAALEQWQEKQLARFRRKVLSKSPWFRQYLSLPFAHWPLMDKALMMTHFDEMNTAGLQCDALMACALQSEQSRDFTPQVGRFSVGLSSGTSGRRGLFVVSPHERRVWAAGILAKVLPDGLFAGERVALFLRADNNLYQSVNNRWLSLTFYDLLAPFPQQLKRLAQQAPTLIVAPAQVLRALALAILAGELSLQVKKAISVAEVLTAQDKKLLCRVFGDVGEIYQATEGFLATTCAHGAMHLNEEFIHVEPQWLDGRRFLPIITDFTRTTQPIVRYRLDDVLVASHKPCSCGSATRTIVRIEGRFDDRLQLPSIDGTVQVIFADACSRVIGMTLPVTVEYRLVQTGSTRLQLTADCEPQLLSQCQQALTNLFTRQGVNTSQLQWSLRPQTPQMPFDVKRRRIVCQWKPS